MVWSWVKNFLMNSLCFKRKAKVEECNFIMPWLVMKHLKKITWKIHGSQGFPILLGTSWYTPRKKTASSPLKAMMGLEEYGPYCPYWPKIGIFLPDFRGETLKLQGRIALGCTSLKQPSCTSTSKGSNISAFCQKKTWRRLRSSQTNSPKKDQVPSDLKPISETCVSAKTAPEMEEIPCRHHWRNVFWFVLLNCL